MMDPRDITYYQQENQTPSPIVSEPIVVVSVEELIDQLKTLTGKQRLEILSLFCSSCGTVHPTKGCRCWNDE
ncbi:MAG: hypothetical protein PHG66_01115 [Candidatus Colwellbacteria bacterium]|nr:hypothetical protein [Candidatus Colwellbacteria bacterium]